MMFQWTLCNGVHAVVRNVTLSPTSFFRVVCWGHLILCEARAVMVCVIVLHCSSHVSSILCVIGLWLHVCTLWPTSSPFWPLMGIHYSLCRANSCLDSADKWEHALFSLLCLVDFSMWLFSVFFVEDWVLNRSLREWFDI